MSTVTYVTRRLAVRSMASLRADISDPQKDRGGELSAVSKLVLDSASTEVLGTLQEIVEKQKNRERDVASRIQHTERLASFGQLAAGLAHEIKNPVAGIQGVLEILRDEATDDSQRDLFERLIGETRRITETVQELLHFARPGEPRKVATDVTELIEDAVQLLTAGFARRGISVALATDPDLPRCSLDPAQIRQVLVNIVNNAGEAMESGGSITIRATEFPDGEASSWRSKTTGRVFLETNWRISSSRSTRPRFTAPGLGWRWPAPWWSSTAVRSRSILGSGADPHSSSSCRATRVQKAAGGATMAETWL